MHADADDSLDARASAQLWLDRLPVLRRASTRARARAHRAAGAQRAGQDELLEAVGWVARRDRFVAFPTRCWCGPDATQAIVRAEVAER